MRYVAEMAKFIGTLAAIFVAAGAAKGVPITYAYTSSRDFYLWTGCEYRRFNGIHVS